MWLKKFKIEGFRRIRESEIVFGDATFVIGENNVGKSSILKALEIFHGGKKKLEELDYFFDEKRIEVNSERIVFTAEYSNLPKEAENWKYFKGRILKRTENGKVERYIVYRKTFEKTGKFIQEMMVYKKSLNPIFNECKKASEFIEKGCEKDIIKEIFGNDLSLDTNLTTAARLINLELIDDLWLIDETVEEWQTNPGGIQGNITIKLPRFLMIPAEDRMTDIGGKTGALHKTMNELFVEIRDASDNYTQAQKYLTELAKELDPDDDQKDFGKMMSEINTIVGNVFPETGLHVQTKLDDADSVLKPQFQIEMSSNVKTTPDRQGTGSVRSAAFALLRYREDFLEHRKAKDKTIETRSLIIGFEEPEMFLHPNAANNMRDEIYNLAISSNSQMVCTTHSPYMIDLSKDLDKDDFPNQVLNLCKLVPDSSYPELINTQNIAFNTTVAFKELIDDEKDFVKFILKMDDYVARVFFAKKIIIIEGDTEEIVLRETIKRMPENSRKYVQSNYQIIKARGKAAIIALIKYLKSMGLQPFVIHDKDELKGATKFNEPIKNMLGGDEFRIMLENCIEEVLKYH